MLSHIQESRLPERPATSTQLDTGPHTSCRGGSSRGASSDNGALAREVSRLVVVDGVVLLVALYLKGVGHFIALDHLVTEGHLVAL